MSKWLKRILAVIAAVFVVLLLLVVALPFVIDPNSFKGPLQRAAAGQNVHLAINGPIDWQFYPQLGLSLEDVVIAPLEAPEQPLAQAQSGTAAVAVAPLFSRQVQVNELVLDGLNINLRVDEEGRGNWESLGPQGDEASAPAEEEPAPAGEQGEDLEIAVERISLDNATLRYEDLQSGQRAELQDLSIQLRDVNLQNRPFPFQLSGLLSSSELANPLRFNLQSQLQSNAALDSFALNDAELQLAVGDAELRAQLAGQAQLEPLRYEGRLELPSFNARALLAALGQDLPPTADPNVLTSISFSTALQGDESGLRSERLQLAMDDTRLDGSFALGMPAEGVPSIALELKGNRIDLDRYLPPEEESAESSAPAEQRPSEDAPLPVEALRSLDAQLALSMEEISAMGLTIAKPRLNVSGEGGLWKLNELRADFYEGQLNSQAQLDAREGDSAALTFSANMDGLSVHQLLMDLAEFDGLSGVVTGQLQAQSNAATTNQLMENLSAAFVFTSPQFTFQGVNAEYFYCQMATQLNDRDMPETEWPRRTRITEVEGQLIFEEQRLNIASMVANVENIVLAVSGYVDLQAMDYQLRLPMRLAQQQTSPSGCLVESNFLLSRQVDILGCSGSLEEMDFAEQCGLDRSAVGDLAEAALRYNVEKRTDKKKEELRDELKDRVRERLGEEGERDARNLLRNILNR